MKKLLLVLAILLVAGVGTFAQEVTVGGEFHAALLAQGNPLASMMGVKDAELNVSAQIDDFTTAALEIDAGEGAPITAPAVDDFRAGVDIFGALGLDLPISLGLTVGYFDTYFNGWNYVTRSGEEYYYGGAQGAYLWTMQPSTFGAWEWTIGIMDMFNLHYWNDWSFGGFAVALDGSVSIISFWLGFASDFSDIGGGELWAEVGANVDLGAATLFIPASFVLDLTTGGAASIAWSSGVKAGILDMITVAIGVGGNSAAAFQHLLPEVSAQPIAGLDIYAILDLDLAPGGTHSLDLGVAYDVGAMNINPGVAIGFDPASTTIICGDSYSITGTGFYIDFAVAF